MSTPKRTMRVRRFPYPPLPGTPAKIELMLHRASKHRREPVCQPNIDPRLEGWSLLHVVIGPCGHPAALYGVRNEATGEEHTWQPETRLGETDPRALLAKACEVTEDEEDSTIFERPTPKGLPLHRIDFDRIAAETRPARARRSRLRKAA